MEKQKIKKYSEQIRGVSYKPSDLHETLNDNSIILLRANNIYDGQINFKDVVYVDKSKVSSKQILRFGDVLICASSGSKHLVGKAAQVEVEGEYTFGAFCKVIRPADINVKYLGMYFQSDNYRKIIASISQGANINNIKNENIDDLDILVPDLEEQEKNADVLGKANDIIRKRKEQLVELDNLIKAQFVEMFGDPLTNPLGWEEVVITELCEKICGGGTPSKAHPEYFEGHIPWVSPKDMKSMVIRDSQDHITEEAIENSSTNIIPENSVLMVIRSGILKHTLPVAINAVPVTINQDMKAFIPGEKISTAFLMNYFKAIEPNVLSGVRGVTADNIDFKDFQKRMVILPPMEMQKQFTDFINQVDKLKVDVQKSLDETQLLFDSLMQEYFG